MHQSSVLAEIPGFGRVYDCGECGGIHVTVGPLSVTLTPEAYMQFVDLIHTSAANFEGWLASKRPCDSDADGSFRADVDGGQGGATRP